MVFILHQGGPCCNRFGARGPGGLGAQPFGQDVVQLGCTCVTVSIQFHQLRDECVPRHSPQTLTQRLELMFRRVQNCGVSIVKRTVEAEKDAANHEISRRARIFHSSAVIAHLS